MIWSLNSEQWIGVPMSWENLHREALPETLATWRAAVIKKNRRVWSFMELDSSFLSKCLSVIVLAEQVHESIIEWIIRLEREG